MQTWHPSNRSTIQMAKPEMFSTVFECLDADGDQMISKQEFSDGLSRMGLQLSGAYQRLACWLYCVVVADQDLVGVMSTMDHIHQSDGHEYGFAERQGKVAAAGGNTDGMVDVGEFAR